MCGIAVLVGEGASRAALERMSRVAARRGPELLRTLTVGNCLFAHAALRFVEVSDNEQPCVVDDCVLIWNGEIYNWRELDCQSRNDTQALLSGLRAHGSEFLTRLDAQFAFVALIDGQLCFGRDKWGICPLVFGHTPEGWLAIGSTSEVVEAAGVSEVKTVPAGTFCVVRAGEVVLRSWYHLPRTRARLARITPADVRRLAEQRVCSRIPDAARDLFTTMGGMDSQFVSACVARHTRGAFGGAVTIVPAGGGGDYPYVQQTLRQLASEGIEVPHHLAALTPEIAHQNLDRLLQLLGPDLFQVMCALGEDLVAAVVQRLGGRTIMTAGGPDEAGRSYDRWTFIHRGLDEELAWHRLAEQFPSSEGVRAGLVFGERGIENRVPLADLIELATEIDPEHKQRVFVEGDGVTLASMRMDGKLFWREALRGVLPDACLAARKEPIHGSIGALPVVAELARHDRAYQQARAEFALHAFWLGWNGIIFADLRTLDPRDEVPECQLYALYRWSRLEPRRWKEGAQHRYGPFIDYIPRSADDPLQRAHKPLCYDWQLGKDVPIRPVR
ncbi:MAG TPA: asparagine synthase-related protein [Polyangiales bacterium]|nr:asparagine synthase-related protein [Polyangiales bacterium]